MSKVGNWDEAADELNGIVASFDEGEVSVDDLFTKLELSLIHISEPTRPY